MMNEYPVEFLKDVESFLDHLHSALREAIQTLQDTAPK